MKKILIHSFLILSYYNIYGQCFENNSDFDTASYYSSFSDIMLSESDMNLVSSINSVFFTNPVVIYYRNTENAVFRLTKKIEPKECRACPKKYFSSNDGYVFLGKEFLREASKQKTDAGGEGLGLFNRIFIISHEIAHSFQYKNFSKVKGIDLFKVYANENNKTIELGADFLSGIYLGLLVKKTKSQKAFTNPMKEAINEVSQFIFSKGDSKFLNRKHHGTGAERFSAFYEGYKLGLTRKINEPNLLFWSVQFMNKISNNEFPESKFKTN